MSLAGHDIDAGLVASLNRGDRAAFATIYRKYAAELYAYARRNISRKEDCEEMVQDIFESLWSRRESIRIEVSLRFYLLKMVKYKTIRYFRDKGVRKRHEEHFLLFETVYNRQPELDAEVIQARIDRLISELPERCQVALRLRLRE